MTEQRALEDRVIAIAGVGGGLGPLVAASLAEAPVFGKGNTQVTITLKPYTWSDGKPVTSRDFTFLFNLLKANKKSWAAYLPGDIPDNVKQVKVVDDRTFTLVLDRAYSPIWFTGNQLSQLTFRGLEVFALVGLFYVLLSLPIAWLSRVADGYLRAKVAR